MGTLPLHVAAENGYVDVTEQLLAVRCNVEHQEQSGGTALCFAAENGHSSVTEMLIEARCNVNHDDYQ